MIDIKEIGRQIGEQVANEPAIAFYPGGFKPAHKGHFAAAKQIAAKPFVNQVKVLIGHGLRDGITAEQSKAIWDLYLQAEPNPKISVEISPDKSPIKPLFSYFANLDNRGYVAGAKKEIESGYFDTLKDKFADRVMPLVINDEFVDRDGDRVSGTEFRATIDELKSRYQALRQEQKGTTEYTVKLNDYNNTYEYLKSLMPDSVINKGLFDDVLRVLKLNFPTPKSLQENQPNPKNQPQYIWLEEDKWLEEYKNKNQFNPAIFDGEDIDPKVKELLLRIATYFWESLEVDEPFEDVTLTGSSVNYNYTPVSDIDLHILVDFNKFDDPELIKKFFDAKKNIFNDKYDLKLGKQPIEIYIQDTNDQHTSSGVYSVMNDEWIKKPEYESINIPDGNIKRKSKPFKEKINNLIQNGKNNPEATLTQIKKLKERIKNFRQSGLDKSGEYSLENLAFKDLRNTGYLDKLSQLSNNIIDKQLSLNEGTQTNIFEKFMSYACQELNIENPPSFEIKTEFGEEQPSFGAYVPSDHHIFLNPSNRNIVDILRTLAHELVHAKQNELELLEPNSGDTGSDIENDANAIAGILMRDYGKQNPDIYNIGVLNEQVTKKKVICDNCGWSWKKEDGGKDLYMCHKCGHDNTPKLNEEKNLNFYDLYKNQILSKMREYLDKPLNNVKKNNDFDYTVFEDNIKANFIIRPKYFSPSYSAYKYFPENTNKTFDVSWSFSNEMTQNEKTPQSFLRVTATAYKVLNDFIQNKQPNVIAFSGLSKGHESVYYGDVFLKRLKVLFGDEYDIVTDKEASMIYIIDKSVSLIKDEAIKKRSKITSLSESILYWKYPYLHPDTSQNIINKKHIKNQVMKEIYLLEEKQKITRIYFDLDGVLAGFDEKFRNSNKEGLDFKEYIGKYGSSKAWDIINKGKSEYWSSMDWNLGGKGLYDYVTKIAEEKGIEVWILSSPGLDPNGDTTKGKNEWVDKHLNIPLNRRVYKQAKNKYTEAKPGYLLIDDMGKNVSEFIEAGGYGIKNNPENSIDSIKKLNKFGL